mmetsp:Transcript_47999/g.153849  ORF Transcript_47999/g.153849 Transcript_47999/m.153849 type:complete len:207 (+) Transcript_47999:2385-3005(+)
MHGRVHQPFATRDALRRGDVVRVPGHAEVAGEGLIRGVTDALPQRHDLLALPPGEHPGDHEGAIHEGYVGSPVPAANHVRGGEADGVRRDRPDVEVVDRTGTPLPALLVVHDGEGGSVCLGVGGREGRLLLPRRHARGVEPRQVPNNEISWALLASRGLPRPHLYLWRRPGTAGALCRRLDPRSTPSARSRLCTIVLHLLRRRACS